MGRAEAGMKAIGAMFAVLAMASPVGVRAQGAGLTGDWIIRATQGEATASARLHLEAKGDDFSGSSGPLDTLGLIPLEYHGRLGHGVLHLAVRFRDFELGEIDLKPDANGLSGAGRLSGSPLSLTARRPDSPGRAPGVFDVDPPYVHVLTSAAPAPIQRLIPGDTVHTRTADAYGDDEKDRPLGMPGNPGTGPFYVEGALPGDTLAIHILKLTPNRATARMSGLLVPSALTPGYAQQPATGRNDIWTLDVDHGLARPQAPSERLKDFSAPLRPMLGVVAVAPRGAVAVPNTDLGDWGGNLDYPEVREGVTLYLPVGQPGALLYMGDAHGRQGDGEITGQGLETSMAVEFKVDVVKGQVLGQPWAENADFVMVSGIGGSMDDAFQRATAGLARWLKARYQLDDSDVAAVLGSSVRYDIAEVVDPKFHVVAKIGKDVLARISPAPASSP
jgi:acetamidase/formamidase